MKFTDLNIIPANAKQKRPIGNWEDYQDKKYDQPIPVGSDIGAITGLNGHWVVDIDSAELFDEFKDYDTLITKSGKGYHIHFYSDEAPKNAVLTNPRDQHIDIRGKGGFIMLPPSKHYTKDGIHDCNYEVFRNSDIMHITANEINEKLISLGFNVKNKRRTADVIKDGLKTGSRNNDLYRTLAKLVGTNGFDIMAAQREAEIINSKSEEPLPQSEVDQIVQSVMNRVEPYGDTLKKGRQLIYDDETDSYSEQDSETESEKLYKLLLTQITRSVVSSDGSNTVYVSANINGHMENLSLESEKAIDWIRSLSSKPHSDAFYKDILNHHSSIIRMDKDCKRQKIYTRIAQIGNVIWYDLGRPDWKAVKLEAGKVEIVQLDEDSPMFRRPSTLYEQMAPIFKREYNGLEKLVSFLSIQDEKLFKINIIASLLENVSTPMIVLHGEAGGFKTTISSFVKRIIDPAGHSKDDNVQAINSEHDNLVISLSKRYMSSFDNVRKITEEMSDILCRAVTGGSNYKRKLYSNDDEVVLTFRRKIIMNGLDIPHDQTDFVSRIITYTRRETTRKPDNELEAKFREIMPYALGDMFDILSKALQRKPEIEPQYRLAEFEVYGDLIAKELGVDNFQEIYSKKRDEIESMAEEEHPMIPVVLKLMEGRETWTETVSNAFNVFRDMIIEDNKNINIKDLNYPKSANKLRNEITICTGIFRKRGLDVRIEKNSNNTRSVLITRIKKSGLQKF